MLRQLGDRIPILALDHDPNNGLRARGPQYNPTSIAKFRFDCRDRIANLWLRLRIDGSRHFDAQHGLRHLLHTAHEFLEATARAFHHREDL